MTDELAALCEAGLYDPMASNSADTRALIERLFGMRIGEAKGHFVHDIKTPTQCHSAQRPYRQRVFCEHPFHLNKSWLSLEKRQLSNSRLLKNNDARTRASCTQGG